MLNFTSTYYDNILSVIVASVKIYNHVPIDRSNVVNISQNRLSHHVFSVNVVVNIFHKGFFRVLVSSLQLLPDCVFFHFKVIVIIY
jgi:hypothetical protein